MTTLACSLTFSAPPSFGVSGLGPFPPAVLSVIGLALGLRSALNAPINGASATAVAMLSSVPFQIFCDHGLPIPALTVAFNPKLFAVIIAAFSTAFPNVSAAYAPTLRGAALPIIALVKLPGVFTTRERTGCSTVLPASFPAAGINAPVAKPVPVAPNIALDARAASFCLFVKFGSLATACVYASAFCAPNNSPPARAPPTVGPTTGAPTVLPITAAPITGAIPPTSSAILAK